MSEIQIVKLATGEDLIGEVSEVELPPHTGGDQTTQPFLMIEKPALIMMMPKPGSETEFGVGLAPYAPFAKEHKVPIFPQHVVSCYQPETDLLNAYNSKFGAGLIQPDFINKKVLNEFNGSLKKK